ncbi:MAG: HAD-IIB family hydrolase [Gammaproteobacteria bacterium]
MDSQIVIFTDLDGTLLDHDSYSYDAAKPALDYIHKHNIPLIFTTSKTAIEIEHLCEQTDFYHPYIAENGGLLAIPENYFSEQDTTKNYTKTIIGKTRAEINHVLNNLTNSYKFKSFNDMSIDELVSYTGLEQNQAYYANLRDSTEPLLWMENSEKITSFVAELKKHDLSLISGGRFHHVMGRHDKAATMSTLLDKFTCYWNTKIISIALGDSPNDLEMLYNANHGVIIPNPNAPRMCAGNHVNLSYAEKPGPQGWSDSLLALLKELRK